MCAVCEGRRGQGASQTLRTADGAFIWKQYEIFLRCFMSEREADAARREDGQKSRDPARTGTADRRPRSQPTATPHATAHAHRAGPATRRERGRGDGGPELSGPALWLPASAALALRHSRPLAERVYSFPSRVWALRRCRCRPMAGRCRSPLGATPGRWALPYVRSPM